MSEEWGTHNVFRDDKVHVMAAMCGTCIFNPHTRPMEGSRVAEMVRETRSEEGSSVVCHHTLGQTDDGRQINAVCRGWYDRLSDGDVVFRLAKAMGRITLQTEEAW